MSELPDPDDALAMTGWMLLTTLRIAAVGLALADMVLVYFTYT